MVPLRMANLTIKGLPDPIHQELKKVARSEGKSLNGYILSLLEMSVEERQRRRIMRESRKEFGRFVASLPPMKDSTSLLRQDRRRGR